MDPCEYQTPKRAISSTNFYCLTFTYSVARIFPKNIQRENAIRGIQLNIEELIQNIGQQIKKDEPLFVNVNDEDGTKVEIYTG
jgi:hypothetical protein